MTADQSIDILQMLAERLERLSVDSRWARRASGLRGSILKILEQSKLGETVSANLVNRLTETAFEILRLAAQDIPNPEDLTRKKVN